MKLHCTKELNDEVSRGSPSKDAIIIEFLRQHLLDGVSTFSGFHFSLGIYYLYLVESLKQADLVENGEVFDEYEIVSQLSYLQSSKMAVFYFKKEMGLNYKSITVDEKINMKDCIVEKGEISGDIKQAAAMANMWIREFVDKETAYWNEEIDISENERNGYYFMYEAGVYILTLCNKVLNYDFIEELERLSA